MSPQRDQFESLLRDLQRLTEEGRVSWDETADENTFRVTFKKGMVTIERGSRDDEDAPRPTDFYRAVLLDARNRVVDEFEPTDGEEAALLAALYGAARSQALRSDDVFADIRREINTRLPGRYSR